VRRLKDDYLYGNDVAYDRVAALGYAIYHLLPAYYATIGYVLDDLTENGLLDRTLRVLDVGAGVGGPALGLHDYLPDDAVVDYHAVEAERSRRRARPDARRDGAELPADDPRGDGGVLLWDRRRGKSGDNDPDEFDLVVFGNVLSELDDPVAVVEAALGRLADDRSVVAFAPADRNTAMGLREVERAVATPRPASRRTRPRSGSGRTRPRTVGGHSTWPTTSISRRSSAGSTRTAERGSTDEPGEFVNVDVQFAYAILRPDGKRRVDVQANDGRCARMADSEEHVTDRVNYLAVKLSHDLSDGDNALYRVGDGSQTVDHYLVCTRDRPQRRPSNRRLRLGRLRRERARALERRRGARTTWSSTTRRSSIWLRPGGRREHHQDSHTATRKRTTSSAGPPGRSTWRTEGAF